MITTTMIRFPFGIFIHVCCFMRCVSMLYDNTNARTPHRSDTTVSIVNNTRRTSSGIRTTLFHGNFPSKFPFNLYPHSITHSHPRNFPTEKRRKDDYRSIETIAIIHIQYAETFPRKRFILTFGDVFCVAKQTIIHSYEIFSQQYISRVIVQSYYLRFIVRFNLQHFDCCGAFNFFSFTQFFN